MQQAGAIHSLRMRKEIVAAELISEGSDCSSSEKEIEQRFAGWSGASGAD